MGGGLAATVECRRRRPNDGALHSGANYDFFGGANYKYFPYFGIFIFLEISVDRQNRDCESRG